ncbi:hypothetical protein SAMN05192529_101242 [Arachidicoccus rhizosphaerae]|uniref:Uncharacterized protein n=1 Tax=Arachidicoccus rhizosphaerae TaxID=551991 RepID=A0A1H3VL48_9BACT|nr:hypothetical protein SAMN05192529_101242 [Arachidicoccus rhizosphaerae]
MKYYKYILYKLYKWALNKNRGSNTPITSVVTTMVTVHMIQLFAIYNFILAYFDVPIIYNRTDLILYIIIFIAADIVFHLTLCTQKKCKSYLEIFQKENKRQSKLGSLFVLLYIFGSFILVALSIWLMYNTKFKT